MFKVVSIYTAKGGLHDMITAQFQEVMSDVQVCELTDAALLGRVMEDKGVEKPTMRRMLHLFQAAAQSGADLVLSSCSTVGDAAELAQKVYDFPLIRIDEAMVTKAVREYSRIAVLASVETTLGPTERFLNSMAEKEGKKITVQKYLAKGAIEAAFSGDGEKHNELVLAKAMEIQNMDVILLAQASLMTMEKSVAEHTGLPTLSSPRLCAELIAEKRAEGLL